MRLELVPISHELRLTFNWDGLRLAGSLHLPEASGPRPAVVMAQGSGSTDRDSGGYFVPIRRAFSDRGIATFAFDKPGCGESTGDWQRYTLDDRARQLLTALAFVGEHPDIDRGRLGIFGHSQGAWLVQKLAGEGARLAFAISSSGPTISVQEQILYECEQAMRSTGRSEDETHDALSLAKSLQQAAVEGLDFESVSRQLLQPASREAWYESFPSIDDAGDWNHTRLLIAEPHEPMADLQRIACPFLAVYGGLDELLPPWRGVEESGRALRSAENTDAAVVVFPHGNHRMQNGDSEDFVDGYLDMLADWTVDRTR